MTSAPHYDFIIVGGGLSGCLLAYRLASLEKNYSILIVEKDVKLGGNHTWSFHETDIPLTAKDWFLPLASKLWDSHSVTFPRFSRKLNGRYGSIRSSDFNVKIQKERRIDFLFEKEVSHLDSNGIRLADGTRMEAAAVIDARGFADLESNANAYQKFVGLTVRLKRPHGLTAPVLMDATVEQIDGYRFLYLLPWTDSEILLEDTYYSDTPHLPREKIKERLYAYIQKKGWEVSEVLEEEEGILPIPLYEGFLRGGTTSLEALEHAPVPLLGVRVGFFNRTTGFSLPLVLQAIERIVESGARDSVAIIEVIKRSISENDAQQRKFCFLNRVLFLAVEFPLRYTVLERFYELPETLVSKFYATQMGVLDWIRFYSRKPPVPIRKALQSGFKMAWT